LLILSFFLYWLLLMLVVSIHEFAHSWVAYRCGDTTPKLMGRLSLNPLVHIDPLATLLMPFFLFIITKGRFIFGAAKPVPINHWLLRNPKRDIIWIGIAGPLANILLAFFIGLMIRFIPSQSLLTIILNYLAVISLILGIFNLIPIPPLDGSRIVMGILPSRFSYLYARLEPYGIIIIMLILWMGFAETIILPSLNIMVKLFGLMRI